MLGDEPALTGSGSLPRIPSADDPEVEVDGEQESSAGQTLDMLSALELKEYDRSPNADLTEDIDAEDMGIVITTNVDSEAVAEGMVVQLGDSSMTSSQCSARGVTKSRSIFLQVST